MPRERDEIDDPLIPAAQAGLLDHAGELAGAHVLVLGAGALPVLCGLIRRGAAAAAEAGWTEHAGVEPAELIVVPRVASLQQAARAVAIAGRALLPCGRIVLRDLSGGLSRDIGALLRAAGFVAIRASAEADGPVITAERPMFGPAIPTAWA